MKREYFTTLFIFLAVAIILFFTYFMGEDFVKNNLYTFIVIWILIAFNLGQYSMKFPKRF